jgi:PAS domain S-box-containing protein
MSPSVSKAKASVLIVADDALLSKDLETSLQGLGYSILGTAPTIENALEMIELHRPDLVVLDLAAPGETDTLDVAALVRDKWGLPVILLLEPADTSRLDRSKLPCPFGYLLKPLQGHDLKITVEMALYAAQADRDRRKTIEALAVSERKYRLLAENAVDVIFTLNMDLQYTYVSPSVFKLRGFTADEVMTQTLGDVLTPDSFLYATQVISDELENERLGEGDPHRTQSLELEMTRQDGATVWAEVKSSFLRDEDGRAIGILGVTRDLTERVQAEAALRESQESIRKKLQAVLEPEGDLDSLELSDIIDSRAVQSLMDDFYRLTKIGVGIIDLNGKILVATGWQDICTKFHRVHPETNQFCATSDTELAGGVEPGKFKYYRCKNNLWDIATPIMLGNRHIGNLFLGQFFFDDETPDRDLFRRQAIKYGFDEEAYLQALDRVPRWSRQTVDTVMTFYTKFAQILSAISYSNLHLARALSEKDALVDRLRKSEEQYRMLVDNSSDIVWNFDPSSMTFNFFSNSGERLLGYSLKTGQSMNLNDIFSPETRKMVLSAFDRVYQGRSPTDRVMLEAEHRTIHGDTLWMEINAVLQRDDLGRPLSFTGSSRDITERRQAQQELRKSESRLRAIFEHSPLGMILFDTEGTIVDCNEKFVQLMGSNREKLIGFNTARQSTPQMQTAIRQALAGHTAAYEDLYTSVTGQKTLYLRVVFNPVNPGQDPTSVIATLEDITERQRSEEALRESEARYRLITDTLTDYIYTVYIQNGQAGYTQHSPACAVITGYTPEEFAADPYLWIDIVVEEDRAKLQDWVSYLHQGRDPGYIEHRIRRKDGRVIWVRDTPVLKYGPARDLISYDGLIQDITERKLAEEALRDSEARFKQLFDNMADGVAIYQAVDDGLDFVFVDLNRQAQLFSKISLEEAVGQRVTQAFPAVEQFGLLDVFRRVYRTGKPEEHPLTLYKDGRIVEWVENYVFKLPSGLIVALYADTSEKHKARMVKEQLQEQLAQAQKMEAIGILAGGISHDFNNLLQAITGYTQIMLLDKNENDPDYSSLEAIQNAGNRAAELVRQLLLFSRKADTTRRPVQLNQEIEQARRILERTIPKMIDFEVHPGGRLWTVNADPVQIERILLNLGTNAADAMPDGGTLTIETKNILLDGEYALTHLGAKPGPYVLLSVSDTGQGMDDETIGKIFDPFFTTKGIGQGTGLGLASVYGIVTSHDGYINCYSEIGRGTTFKIYLPAIEPADTVEPVKTAEKPPPGGAETILLVDDEASIRDFASQALQKFGYTVLTASSGEAALDIYSSRFNEIDLVVTDIGMPGMGGHRCLQELLQINPAARIIIASGYPIDGQIGKTLDAGSAGYIGKPYNLTELLDKVRSVLDEVKE